MATGLAVAHANSLLGVLRGTTYTGLTIYVKLHTGDPGAAGTANASSVTTRNAITYTVPSSGSMSLSSVGSWSMTGTETLSYVSLWDASSAGNFIESWPLSVNVPVINGSTFVISTFTRSYTPVAA